MTTQGIPQRRDRTSTPMLKALLAAILVALLVLIYLLMVPSSRPERTPLNPAAIGGAPPASSFVIHNDAPPTVAPPPATTPAPTNSSGFTINGAPTPAPAPDASANSLDAVMQRLRAGKPDATVVVTPNTPSAATAVAPPINPPPTNPPPVVPAPEPVPAAPPPTRWTNVTGQGVQFRLSPVSDGVMIAIDLGGGQVAQVHALPAFGRLDPSAVNTRVDYLKQTILENFPFGSASYLFNRDGSVTRAR